MDKSEAYDPDAHAAFRALDPPIPVLGDAEEWEAWNAIGDPVLHIQVGMILGVCYLYRSSLFPQTPFVRLVLGTDAFDNGYQRVTERIMVLLNVDAGFAWRLPGI